MRAPRIFEVVPGKTFEQDDIAGQTNPAMDTLEEVMAENGIFGHAPGNAAMESMEVVNALADENSSTKQVLIDVRDSPAVNVD